MTSAETESRRSEPSGARARVFVGSYESAPGAQDGGIRVFDLAADGTLIAIDHVPEPGMADTLAYAASTNTLYSVDLRRNTGRGSTAPAAAIWAYDVDPATGHLTFRNQRPAPGPNPNYLSLNRDETILVSANHGGFDHVERVRRGEDGGWVVDYDYDDSTVIVFSLDAYGGLGPIRDLHLRSGHGRDPNGSPQAGGHAQASPHAHSCMIDPSGRWVIVCDKGTDEVLVLALEPGLPVASVLTMPAETGPRHLAFDHRSGLAFLTCEISSELASLEFDTAHGRLRLLDRRTSTLPGHARLNEPAALAVHPGGRFVFMNNRGEDTVCWWSFDGAGRLHRVGHVELTRSEHPGVAARHFAFDGAGSLLLVADLPGNRIRSYRVTAGGEVIEPWAVTDVPAPAFVLVVEPEPSEQC